MPHKKVSPKESVFKEVLPLFANQEEFDAFLNTKTSSFGDATPLEFLSKSKRDDKYEFFKETIIQLKSHIGDYND